MLFVVSVDLVNFIGESDHVVYWLSIGSNYYFGVRYFVYLCNIRVMC